LTKADRWTDEEYEILLGNLKTCRTLEENEGLEKLSRLDLWKTVAQFHQQEGFDRTWKPARYMGK